jgi:hypothetical protein
MAAHLRHDTCDGKDEARDCRRETQRVDPLKEISQEGIDRIVDEWDARQPDPTRWVHAEGVEFTVHLLPAEASAIDARARREGKTRDELVRELAYAQCHQLKENMNIMSH